MRTPVKYEKEFPVSDNLQIVKGDVTDVASLEAALEGVDNVIFTASGSGYWSAPTVDFQVSDLPQSIRCYDKHVSESLSPAHQLFSAPAVFFASDNNSWSATALDF